MKSRTCTLAALSFCCPVVTDVLVLLTLVRVCRPAVFQRLQATVGAVANVGFGLDDVMRVDATAPLLTLITQGEAEAWR